MGTWLATPRDASRDPGPEGVKLTPRERSDTRTEELPREPQDGGVLRPGRAYTEEGDTEGHEGKRVQERTQEREGLRGARARPARTLLPQLAGCSPRLGAPTRPAPLTFLCFSL